MTIDVLCLRPEADFLRARVTPPDALRVAYRADEDPDVPALMKQARALIIPAVGPKLAPRLFENTTLKLVQITGAGLDRLDLPLMKRLGIPVANVPGGSNQAVAEYVITVASVLLRRFAWADAEIRAGRYREARSKMLADNLSGLAGLAVGVVGLGVIGRAVAEALYKNGCHLLYFDPAPRDPKVAAACGAKSVSLDQLLKTADVVTLHVPLLPSTQGLLGARELALMKRGTILIQASRGGIVEQAALAAALKSGHLGGAAVDVFSTEPPAPDNPLLTLSGEAAQRIFLTPHIAGVTRQASAFLFRSAWRNIERVLHAGEPPLNRAC